MRRSTSLVKTASLVLIAISTYISVNGQGYEDISGKFLSDPKYSFSEKYARDTQIQILGIDCVDGLKYSITNNYSEKLDIHVCFERKDNTWKCEIFTVQKGKPKKSYSCNTTGRYFVLARGSKESQFISLFPDDKEIKRVLRP